MNCRFSEVLLERRFIQSVITVHTFVIPRLGGYGAEQKCVSLRASSRLGLRAHALYAQLFMTPCKENAKKSLPEGRAPSSGAHLKFPRSFSAGNLPNVRKLFLFARLTPLRSAGIALAMHFQGLMCHPCFKRLKRCVKRSGFGNPLKAGTRALFLH